ncbi:unnamed protein product [Dicrocoelium dendriticum]|nr:unnamed protein product [Dicrocoelium dendriticum]
MDLYVSRCYRNGVGCRRGGGWGGGVKWWGGGGENIDVFRGGGGGFRRGGGGGGGGGVGWDQGNDEVMMRTEQAYDNGGGKHNDTKMTESA